MVVAERASYELVPFVQPVAAVRVLSSTLVGWVGAVVGGV